MGFIRKFKKLIFVCLILIIILSFMLYKTLSVDTSKSEYGDRLDGIQDVKVGNKTISKLESEIKELEEVKSCKYRLQGRLIYIEITFNDEVSIEVAKEIANKTLEYFDEEEKAYYDIQLILKNKNKEAEGYPKFGYKHKSKAEIAW